MGGIGDNALVRWAGLVCAGAGMALAGCGAGSGGASGSNQVATPQFFLQGGAGQPTLAIITDSTPGALIYYTTDGSNPTTASTLYTGPVTVLQTETITAIAVATGYAPSAVTDTTYVLQQAQAPVFSVAQGTYTWPQTVAITDSTAGTLIFYTTDGTTPTTSSLLYTGPITVSGTETIQAIAVAGGYTSSTIASVTYTINLPQPGAVLTGVVADGQQPVAGAHVYLMVANTTGYGQASVDLLNAAQTGTADAVGAYVTTDSNGNFSMTGDFACSSGLQQVYLLALGGNAGQGSNVAAGLMAAIGTCPSGAGPATFATMNEVTTIAAAYAMAAFATDATHVSSSGTMQAQLGVITAFANAANLVSLASGAAQTTTSAGNGTAPQAEMNTLGNILATCVGSSGATSAACSALFGDARSGGVTGTAPAETATAAIFIAHHPGANPGALYALAGGSGPFAPALSAQPATFAVWVEFTGAVNSANAVAIDGSGNVWIANEGGNNVVELSGVGGVLSGTRGFTGRGLRQPYGIAVDAAQNVWVTDAGVGITRLASAGANDDFAGIHSPPNSVLDGATGIAIDAAGSAWIANYEGNSISVVSSTDALIATYTGGGITAPKAVAMDSAGNAWVANGAGGSVSRISSAGVVSQYTGGGLSDSDAVAVDHAGDAWALSEQLNGVAELSPGGAFLSGASGYGPAVTGLSIAVDGAGNVWSTSVAGLEELSNAGSPLLLVPGLGRNGIAVDGAGSVWLVGATVIQVVGAATPVVTPLAVGVEDGRLGTAP